MASNIYLFIFGKYFYPRGWGIIHYPLQYSTASYNIMWGNDGIEWVCVNSSPPDTPPSPPLSTETIFIYISLTFLCSFLNYSLLGFFSEPRAEFRRRLVSVRMVLIITVSHDLLFRLYPSRPFHTITQSLTASFFHKNYHIL